MNAANNNIQKIGAKAVTASPVTTNATPILSLENTNTLPEAKQNFDASKPEDVSRFTKLVLQNDPDLKAIRSKQFFGSGYGAMAFLNNPEAGVIYDPTSGISLKYQDKDELASIQKSIAERKASMLSLASAGDPDSMKRIHEGLMNSLEGNPLQAEIRNL